MHRLLAALALCLLAACGRAETTTITGDGPGGPFQLVNQDGAPTTEQILEDKWSLVFFGFTHCPDICPTTLQRLRATEDVLGRRAQEVQVILISVDPERDTPEALKAYVAEESFPEDTIGLTGTPEQIAEVLKTYKAFASKSGEGEDYIMNHTSAVYMMDPRGEFVRPLAPGMTPEEMATQIRDAMRLKP